MKDYRSWAQSSWCYEQLSAMDDMSHFVYEQIRALDVMNNSRLWLT